MKFSSPHEQSPVGIRRAGGEGEELLHYTALLWELSLMGDPRAQEVREEEERGGGGEGEEDEEKEERRLVNVCS